MTGPDQDDGFLKGCPLRCFWCQNPESQRMEPEILFDARKCTSCGECIKVCPNGATSQLQDRIRIDRDRCRGCARCVEVCLNEARRLAGRSMTVDEVMREVMKDAKFYENSGGGVTLSGGDPLAQPQFALSILQRCKRAGFHTALDTCGYAPWPTIENLIKYVDLVLFDIKHMDPEKHRDATGKDNQLILENVKKIARLRPMRVRVPIIPGFNDSVEAIRTIAHFEKKELNIADIDLLSYNKLGESKYEFLDKSYASLQSIDEGHFEALCSCVREEASQSS